MGIDVEVKGDEKPTKGFVVICTEKKGIVGMGGTWKGVMLEEVDWACVWADEVRN